MKNRYQGSSMGPIDLLRLPTEEELTEKEKSIKAYMEWCYRGLGMKGVEWWPDRTVNSEQKNL